MERCYGGRNIYTSLRGVLISLSEKIIQSGEKMKAAGELVKKYKEEIADSMDEKEKKGNIKSTSEITIKLDNVLSLCAVNYFFSEA